MLGQRAGTSVYMRDRDGPAVTEMISLIVNAWPVTF